MARIGSRSKIVVFAIVILKIKSCSPVDWGQVKCSVDVDQQTSEGRVSLGKFPWLGVVQHTFRLDNFEHFAVTTGVLIHPGYVIAAADDISRVPRDQLTNNTKFIVWYDDEVKYALDVVDYLLHPEFEEKTTLATLALLELYTQGETGISDYKMVVLPVCLPLKGYGTFDEMYATRISDDSGAINKEIMKMNYVPNRQCEEYYYKAELSDDMMKPRRPLCAVAENQRHACVWDAGVALISRQSWGHWMLLGFSMRGPGCGAPARFVSLHEFLPWIDDVLSLRYGGEPKTVKLYFRRQRPHKLQMYSADVKLPKDIGFCERRLRGSVQYKDDMEIITTKNFAQGFYFVSVMQVSSFLCVNVIVEVLARTNAAVWVEHHCHRDMTGLSHGHNAGPDFRKIECFAYYKTSAFVEFRFYFSFRAMLEVTMYGKGETKFRMPNPFWLTETTDPWNPTDALIKWTSFFPYYKSYWYL